MTETSSTS